MNLENTTLLLNYLFDGAYLVDQNRTIIFWNNSAEMITGYKASEIVGGRCYDTIMLHIDEKGESLCDRACPLKQTIKDALPKEQAMYLRHKQGHRIPVTIRTVPIIDDSGIHKFTMETFTLNNATNNIGQIQDLVRKAFIDSLSGLPNKEYMNSKLRSLLAAESFGTSNILGLFFIRLDNLREINDAHGAVVGNTVINVIAKTLSQNMQPGDLVGRLDGGLFLIITHLDKTSLVLNWANKLKALLLKSTLLSNDEISPKLYISGLVTPIGESLETIYSILDEELKLSYHVPNNISIRGYTPPR